MKMARLHGDLGLRFFWVKRFLNCKFFLEFTYVSDFTQGHIVSAHNYEAEIFRD